MKKIDKYSLSLFLSLPISPSQNSELEFGFKRPIRPLRLSASFTIAVGMLSLLPEAGGVELVLLRPPTAALSIAIGIESLRPED